MVIYVFFFFLFFILFIIIFIIIFICIVIDSVKRITENYCSLLMVEMIIGRRFSFDVRHDFDLAVWLPYTVFTCI